MQLTIECFYTRFYKVVLVINEWARNGKPSRRVNNKSRSVDLMALVQNAGQVS